MDSEIDVIQHLLEVERNASLMLKDAQKEADQIIAEARTVAEEEFKKEYAKIVAEVEKVEEEKKVSLSTEHNEEYKKYCDSLNSQEIDREAFVSKLEACLKA